MGVAAGLPVSCCKPLPGASIIWSVDAQVFWRVRVRATTAPVTQAVFQFCSSFASSDCLPGRLCLRSQGGLQSYVCGRGVASNRKGSSPAVVDAHQFVKPVNVRLRSAGWQWAPWFVCRMSASAKFALKADRQITTPIRSFSNLRLIRGSRLADVVAAGQPPHLASTRVRDCVLHDRSQG